MPGDPMVYLTQRWLNQNYGDVAGFGSVTENGKTGYDTVYGLLRALQHELGITELANSFGPATERLYSQNILSKTIGVTDNKYAILQGALWCKGYAPGYKLYKKSDGTVVFDAVFDDEVEQAVIRLKTDMGFDSPDGTVTTDVMRALMTMDSYKLTGDAGVRGVQQMLNRKYGRYIGIIPCDGVYGRATQKALITALQAQEGMPEDVANGSFGPQTRAHCPVIPYDGVAKSYSGEKYTNNQIKGFEELFNAALLVNGYKSASDFQQFMALPVTAKADLNTWMSLLVSHGNTERAAIAADCMSKLDKNTAAALYRNGYRYVGRYLTVESKAITKQEAQIIFDAGLRFFPIYQTSANKYEYFTEKNGRDDAKNAVSAALKLGLPEGTVIYFSVDFDSTDYHVTNGVLPYFKAVNEMMKTSAYRVGVYGTRNTCTRVSDAGYAVYSFVGDISSGYSGNMGFNMPKNWAFDQFATVNVGGIQIDKNGFSGRDTGVGTLKENVTVDTTKVFKDVETGKWYVNAINYNYTHKFISGVATDQFGVSVPVTRGMFITILARIAGVDTSSNNVSTKFTDVESGKYYTAAIRWASENKIVNGMSAATFEPNTAIQRQQLCVMIVNFAKFIKAELKASESAISFKDAQDISNYAKDAVKAAQMADIVNGYANANGFDFKPKSTATRAEAAQILYKFHKDFVA